MVKLQSYRYKGMCLNKKVFDPVIQTRNYKISQTKKKKRR